MLSYADLKSLSQLLNTDENNSSSDEDLPKTGYTNIGPGDIGRKTKIKITGNKTDLTETQDDPRSIWSPNEVMEVPSSDDALWDPREKPEYDIIYKQAVGSEDIFLQMSNKTTSTASCEHMKITINLKGESKDAIDCHVTTKTLDIRSPRYRLSLPFPHPVDPDKCTAEWNPTKNDLVITLMLNREYDFVNF